ncbi:MAG: hypothetical protein FJY85_04465, partial [Deltaproteobacteria bacterium]|nr:hypothetical protein [Deltaproteobacteria bacterium]
MLTDKHEFHGSGSQGPSENKRLVSRATRRLGGVRKPNASNSTLSKALSALIVTCITMLLIVLIEKVARIMFGPWGSSGIMIFQADDELGFRLESNAFQRHSVSDLRRPFAAN